MSEPFVFRLYPEEGSTLFVRVRVFETLKQMRAHAVELNRHGLTDTRGWSRTMGFCTPWQRWWVQSRTNGGRCRRDPCVAEVSFAWRHCTMNIVTHEFFHAALAWARRVGVVLADECNDDEERIAYVHGHLCRDFVLRAQAAGILE